jgi:hypothetical protein
MRSEWENYCPDQVIFQGTTEPHHNMHYQEFVICVNQTPPIFECIHGGKTITLTIKSGKLLT